MRKQASTRASDALIIGAGPAGASAGILLAQSGWQVSMVEQHRYPRDKVCGGCIAAGNFELLDELGVGASARRIAGPELTRVGWLRQDAGLFADMPACPGGRDPFGRALGRDVLDEMMLERAVAAGVRVFQPFKVRRVSGEPGNFQCEVQAARPRDGAGKSPRSSMTLSASVIIDAHGSWEPAPRFQEVGGYRDPHEAPQRPSDLFAFKTSFAAAALPIGLLPVVALEGGYGGIVVANDGCTTLALCLRRDKLRALRRHHRLAAALAAEAHLLESCRGIRDALSGARRMRPWLTVGPLRPGMRWHAVAGLFPVGNACGECHPLVGEGIGMALQSSKMLAELLRSQGDRITEPRVLRATHESYRIAWQQAFQPRLRFASLCAHVAMRPPLAAAVERCIGRWPATLTTAARLAGKARRANRSPESSEVTA